MTPEEIREKILKHKKVVQCEYCATKSDITNFIWRDKNNKRYAGGVELANEDAVNSFLDNIDNSFKR